MMVVIDSASGAVIAGSLHRLTGFQQAASRNLQTAVGLPLQRVERFPGLSILVDDMNTLRDVSVGHARLAELKAAMA